MVWVLRLAETGPDAAGESIDLIEIHRSSGFADIAKLDFPHFRPRGTESPRIVLASAGLGLIPGHAKIVRRPKHTLLAAQRLEEAPNALDADGWIV